MLESTLRRISEGPVFAKSIGRSTVSRARKRTYFAPKFGISSCASL
jgi:hypothetical protein